MPFFLYKCKLNLKEVNSDIFADFRIVLDTTQSDIQIYLLDLEGFSQLQWFSDEGVLSRQSKAWLYIALLIDCV